MRTDATPEPSSLHPSMIAIEALEADCKFTFSRRSGPGGQHRNKVETCVTVLHVPTGIQATASECRQQGENRQKSLHRLRCQLAVEVRSPTQERELPTQASPSPLWREYIRKGVLRVSADNPQFPAILAESLDALAINDWDPNRAASCLETSASQLIRLLSMYPPALDCLNKELSDRGRKPRMVRK